jgi:hypothetical protein
MITQIFFYTRTRVNDIHKDKKKKKKKKKKKEGRDG